MQKILNCMVSKEKESSNWTHLKKPEDRKEEWGGWEVAMFTVQKNGRGEERGVLRRGPGTITDSHYANGTQFLVRVF